MGVTAERSAVRRACVHTNCGTFARPSTAPLRDTGHHCSGATGLMAMTRGQFARYPRRTSIIVMPARPTVQFQRSVEPMTGLQRHPEWTFDSMIALAARGDGPAFEALYRDFAGRVRAFAAVRSAADPDAITNDVMLRVFQNLNSFSGTEAAFVGWLFTITRNCVIDEFRKRERRPSSDGVTVPEQASSSAEDSAMIRLSGDNVLHLLEQLTPDQREVIALRLIDDLSLADVAAIVGRPVSAVKALQRRGLQRLQRLLVGEVVS